MKKSLLWGAVGALVLTGGYYASAASSPWKYTDYGYVNPVTVKTTSYAPGTPSEYEYPNSPYQIGGKLGPAPGQTWQQKYDAGTAAENAAQSDKAATVATPKTSQAPVQTPSVAGASGAPVSPISENANHGTMAGPNGSAWNFVSFNGVYFPVQPSWHVLQDSATNVDYGGNNGGVQINVVNGPAVYGDYWQGDLTHDLQFASSLYAYSPASYAITNTPHYDAGVVQVNVKGTGQVAWVWVTTHHVYSITYLGSHPSWYFDQLSIGSKEMYLMP